MTDWKTTLAGVLKAVSALAGIIGVQFSPEQQQAVITGAVALYTFFSLLQAYFSKDKD